MWHKIAYQTSTCILKSPPVIHHREYLFQTPTPTETCRGYFECHRELVQFPPKYRFMTAVQAKCVWPRVVFYIHSRGSFGCPMSLINCFCWWGRKLFSSGFISRLYFFFFQLNNLYTLHVDLPNMFSRDSQQLNQRRFSNGQPLTCALHDVPMFCCFSALILSSTTPTHLSSNKLYIQVVIETIMFYFYFFSFSNAVLATLCELQVALWVAVSAAPEM